MVVQPEALSHVLRDGLDFLASRSFRAVFYMLAIVRCLAFLWHLSFRASFKYDMNLKQIVRSKMTYAPSFAYNEFDWKSLLWRIDFQIRTLCTLSLSALRVAKTRDWFICNVVAGPLNSDRISNLGQEKNGAKPKWKIREPQTPLQSVGVNNLSL